MLAMLCGSLLRAKNMMQLVPQHRDRKTSIRENGGPQAADGLTTGERSLLTAVCRCGALPCGIDRQKTRSSGATDGCCAFRPWLAHNSVSSAASSVPAATCSTLCCCQLLHPLTQTHAFVSLRSLKCFDRSATFCAPAARR